MSFCFAQRFAHFSSATWNGSAWKKTSPTLYLAVDAVGLPTRDVVPSSDAAITPTARIPASAAQTPTLGLHRSSSSRLTILKPERRAAILPHPSYRSPPNRQDEPRGAARVVVNHLSRRRQIGRHCFRGCGSVVGVPGETGEVRARHLEPDPMRAPKAIRRRAERDGELVGLAGASPARRSSSDSR